MSLCRCSHYPRPYEGLCSPTIMDKASLNTFIFRLASPSHIYILLFETPIVSVSLHLETRDVATRVLGCKRVQSMEVDILKRSFCNLFALALWLALHIFATQCWWAPKKTKQLSTVAILLYWFSSCWCLRRNVFYVISALQSIVCLQFYKVGSFLYWN